MRGRRTWRPPITRLDDFRPYLYKTTDYGKTWKKIVDGIPNNAFTRVVREDPNRKGLLVAGTETGLYISFDDGENWRRFQLNLPVTPITDFAVSQAREGTGDRDGRPRVLGAGRCRMLYQLNGFNATEDAKLFQPKDTYRFGGGGRGGRGGAGGGENPPGGAVVSSS